MTTQLSIPEHALQTAEIPAFSAVTLTIRATLPTLADKAMPAHLRLLNEAARLGLDVSQPVQWIYTGVNGDERNEFQVAITLPLAHLPAEPPAGMAFETFRPFHCMTYTYAGSWADFGELYDQLFQQFYQTGLKNDGHVREVYRVVDAETPENCVTEIQIGIV